MWGVGGIALFFILFLFLVNYIFFSPSLLSEIYDEQKQVANLLIFSRIIPFPPNRGYDPCFEYLPYCGSVIERTLLLFRYLSWGWVFSLLAALGAVVLGACWAPQKKDYLKKLAGWTGVFCLVGGILFSPYFLAEGFLFYGSLKQKQGLYLDAEKYYRRALRLQPEFINLDPFFYDYVLMECNLTGSKSYCDLAEAVSLSSKADFEEAWWLLQGIKEAWKESVPFNHLLSHTAANIGIQYYKKVETTEALSKALVFWEESVKIVPRQLQSYFYLTYAYSKLGLYHNAINMGEFLVKTMANDTFVAYTYCFIGDACTCLHDDVCARQAYERSFLTDQYNNYRAMWSMTGS